MGGKRAMLIDKELREAREALAAANARADAAETNRDHWRGACVKAMVTGEYPVSPHDDDPQIKSLREAAEASFHGQAYAEMAKRARKAEDALAAARRECAEKDAALEVAVRDGHAMQAERDAARRALGEATADALWARQSLRRMIDVVSSDGDERRPMRAAVVREVAAARAALAAPAAAADRDPAIEDADAAWRDGEAHGRDE